MSTEHIVYGYKVYKCIVYNAMQHYNHYEVYDLLNKQTEETKLWFKEETNPHTTAQFTKINLDNDIRSQEEILT